MADLLGGDERKHGFADADLDGTTGAVVTRPGLAMDEWNADEQKGEY